MYVLVLSISFVVSSDSDAPINCCMGVVGITRSGSSSNILEFSDGPSVAVQSSSISGGGASATPVRRSRKMTPKL